MKGYAWKKKQKEKAQNTSELVNYWSHALLKHAMTLTLSTRPDVLNRHAWERCGATLLTLNEEQLLAVSEESPKTMTGADWIPILSFGNNNSVLVLRIIMDSGILFKAAKCRKVSVPSPVYGKLAGQVRRGTGPQVVHIADYLLASLWIHRKPVALRSKSHLSAEQLLLWFGYISQGRRNESSS